MPETRSAKRQKQEESIERPERKRKIQSNTSSEETQTKKKKKKHSKKPQREKRSQKRTTDNATSAERAKWPKKRKRDKPKRLLFAKEEDIAQEPLSEEKVLKAFDLDVKFGACLGISRLDRWKRAKKFGLNPPEGVRRIVEKYDRDDPRNKCLWNGRV